MAAFLLQTAIVSCLLFQSSFCLSGHLETVYECNTSGPLGMITGQIEDWQISASSTQLNVKDKRCAEKFGRVYQPNGYAWCAKFKSSTEWLQIDLGVPTKVTGLITQGKADGQEWVTSFMLSFSLDAFRWKYIDDAYGNQRVFEGNSDSYRLKHIYLDEAIFARFVKFHTLHWHDHPSLRVEIIGCQTCKRLVGLPPYVQMTSSSELSFKKGRSCRADDGHILTNNAWCAKSDDENQWLQYDVGPPALITGIVTKGRGDTAKKQWVTKFRLSYSNDSRVWHYYKDANHLPPKEFGANADKHLERYHFLNNPFVARYIRFNPASWNTKISMRAGLLGCPHVGECEDGFMHVHPDTPCVENLSYKKETWINSRKQYKRTTTQTQTARSNAALAVDGNTNTTFQSCTILDNYYVETPLWSVDLGDKKRVSGIVILTWQTKNQEHRTTQKENVYNLDRLVVYVDSKERPPATGDEQQQCGSVTRQNEAVMKPRVHVQCVRPLEGRYVHIQAWGVANRRNRLFSAVLCEVMVYA